MVAPENDVLLRRTNKKIESRIIQWRLLYLPGTKNSANSKKKKKKKIQQIMMSVIQTVLKRQRNLVELGPTAKSLMCIQSHDL